MLVHRLSQARPFGLFVPVVVRPLAALEETASSTGQDMSDRALVTLDLSQAPQTAVQEARHLLSERDATQAVLRDMLDQLADCSSQAAKLETLYAGLDHTTAGYKGATLQQLPASQDEASTLELSDLQALVEQKRQQLHELESSSQGQKLVVMHGGVMNALSLNVVNLQHESITLR